MDDLTRLKILLYQFLFFEEKRQIDSVSCAKDVMLRYDFESYYVLKYYEACRRYEDFQEFFRKMVILLR